jgi:hypothetical protein
MRTLVVLLVIAFLSSSAFADRLHLKQGYAIDVDRWEDDPKTGLLWYWQGASRSAVTKSDVLRIEETTARAAPVPARQNCVGDWFPFVGNPEDHLKAFAECVGWSTPRLVRSTSIGNGFYQEYIIVAPRGTFTAVTRDGVIVRTDIAPNP